jgi:hypothetical protein
MRLDQGINIDALSLKSYIGTFKDNEDLGQEIQDEMKNPTTLHVDNLRTIFGDKG